MNWAIEGFQFVPRSREHQHCIIVLKPTVQHRLTHVVDDPIVVVRNWPYVNSLNSVRLTRIKLSAVPEMVNERLFQAGRRWHKNDGVEMQAVVPGE
jgi:hypothetical protein